MDLFYLQEVLTMRQPNWASKFLLDNLLLLSQHYTSVRINFNVNASGPRSYLNAE